MKSKTDPKLAVKICLSHAAFYPIAVFMCTNPVFMPDSIGSVFSLCLLRIQQRSRCNLICYWNYSRKACYSNCSLIHPFPFSPPGLDWYSEGKITLEIFLGVNCKQCCSRSSSITVYTVFWFLKITGLCQHCREHKSFDHIHPQKWNSD